MKGWKEEVVPEWKSIALELAAVREAVPVITKGKLIDISNLTDTWKFLDLEYGDAQEIRTKLKDQVRSIKLKTSGGSAKLVELFHAIQTIAAKIKASGSLALLENDKKICGFGIKISWKWCCKDLFGLSSFFNILEKEAKVAKKMITNKTINIALSGGANKLQKCSTCHNLRPGNYQWTRNAAIVQSADKICPVSNKSTHTYTRNL